jgi:pimeloyl-ACP methyl ester carboxylesterase
LELQRALSRKKEGPVSFFTGGEGDPLLLLHGIPGSAYSWEEVGSHLSAHFKVIIPDLLGFGESDLPTNDYYMESQARAIKGLLDCLGISKLFLAGHDFGGPVALTLMRLFPELEIRGLVLSDTNTFTDTYIPPPLRAASVPVLGTLFLKP